MTGQLTFEENITHKVTLHLNNAEYLQDAAMQAAAQDKWGDALKDFCENFMYDGFDLIEAKTDGRSLSSDQRLFIQELATTALAYVDWKFLRDTFTEGNPYIEEGE